MRIRSPVVFVAAAMTASGLLLSACATEDYVNMHVATVNARVDETNMNVSALGSRVGAVEQRIGGAEQAAEMPDRRVHADRVAEVTLADHLVDEDLLGGLVHDIHEAQEARGEVHLPDLHGPGEHEHSQHGGEHRHRGLSRQQHEPFRATVRDETTDQSEQQSGQGLQRGGDADGCGAAGESEDQPVLGDALHPTARVGQRLAEGEQSVVADAEGSEGGRVGGGDRRATGFQRGDQDGALDVVGGWVPPIVPSMDSFAKVISGISLIADHNEFGDAVYPPELLRTFLAVSQSLSFMSMK